MGKQKKEGKSRDDRMERRFERTSLARIGERKAGPPVKIEVH